MGLIKKKANKQTKISRMLPSTQPPPPFAGQIGRADLEVETANINSTANTGRRDRMALQGVGRTGSVGPTGTKG